MFPILGQVKAVLEEILERVTDEFNLPELMARAEERTPYVVVTLQECERMNMLTRQMQRSLRELDLGLKVGESRLGTGHQGAAASLPRKVPLLETKCGWATGVGETGSGAGIWAGGLSCEGQAAQSPRALSSRQERSRPPVSSADVGGVAFAGGRSVCAAASKHRPRLPGPPPRSAASSAGGLRVT